jgi:hypothetical protein
VTHTYNAHTVSTCSEYYSTPYSDEVWYSNQLLLDARDYRSDDKDSLTIGNYSSLIAPTRILVIHPVHVTTEEGKNAVSHGRARNRSNCRPANHSPPIPPQYPGSPGIPPIPPKSNATSQLPLNYMQSISPFPPHTPKYPPVIAPIGPDR